MLTKSIQRQTGILVFNLFISGIATAWGYWDGLAWEASRFFGVFVFLAMGLILQPIGAELLVFATLVLTAVSGIISLEHALSGYAHSTVWMVVAAMMISQGIISTGLGRRISLALIQWVGKSTLGLGFSLVFTDILLAFFIPSNTARSGGIILPLVKSISHFYESKPYQQSRKDAGAYLLMLAFQSDNIICSMFLTGQASNLLLAQFIASAGVTLSYTQWIQLAFLPGLILVLMLPFILFFLYPPRVQSAAHIQGLLKEEVKKIGPISKQEKLMIGVFVSVVALWFTKNVHGLSFSLVALLGLLWMLALGILSWQDLVGSSKNWDIFIWYGGIIMFSEGLESFHITDHFVNKLSGFLTFSFWGWDFLCIILIYFYTHYFFGSLTSHIAALAPPLIKLCIALKIPSMAIAMGFMVSSNLCACLTHFGTTPAPLYFKEGYVTSKEWYRIGFILSIVYFTYWILVGYLWIKCFL